MNPMGSQMIEASNGILLVLFAYMAGFGVLYLSWKWRELHGSVYQGHGGWWRAIRRLYGEHKPAVAIAVITVGLFLRTLVLWHYRHIRNHQYPLDWFWAHWSQALLWGSTAMIMVGIACWIRVVSPFRHTVKMWLLMLGFAIFFGLYMAS